MNQISPFRVATVEMTIFSCEISGNHIVKIFLRRFKMIFADEFIFLNSTHFVFKPDCSERPGVQRGLATESRAVGRHEVLNFRFQKKTVN